jgi:hypothetical protein
MSTLRDTADVNPGLDIESEFNMTVITPESVRHDYSLLPVCMYKICIRADEAVTRISLTVRNKHKLHTVIKYVTQYYEMRTVLI